MWERIGASSGVVIGAVVLFVAFVVILMLMERCEKKAQSKQKRTPYLLPKPKRKSAPRSTNPMRAKTLHRSNRAVQPREAFRDIGVRKIG